MLNWKIFDWNTPFIPGFLKKDRPANEYLIGGKTYMVLPPTKVSLEQMEHIDRMVKKFFDNSTGEMVFKGEVVFEFMECLLVPKGKKWMRDQIGSLREELKTLTVEEAGSVIGNFYLGAESLLNSFQRFLEIKDIVKGKVNIPASPSPSPSAAAKA